MRHIQNSTFPAFSSSFISQMLSFNRQATNKSSVFTSTYTMTMIDKVLVSKVYEDSHDPLLPSLRSIKEALDDTVSGRTSNSNLLTLLQDCIAKFKHNVQYKNDIRFLKIWLLYMDASEDFNKVFKEMLDSDICADQASLYVWSGFFFESKGRLHDAHTLYQLGISRNAEPLDWLKKAYELFLNRISEIVTAAPTQKIDDKPESMKSENDAINPWIPSTMGDLLKRINALLTKSEGYHSSNKAYTGKVALSSLKNSSRNKIVEIGGKKYQVKGCAGQGGFAQVYKAYVNSNPDEVVALKIQKPAFPWEFYIYRLLDQRISESERPSYGFAHRVHIYSDCSVLVCDYLAHGTLQDVINSYAVLGKYMEEVLCIYYTIEMLHMVETLHDVGIIHGDFKPDNLLIRYASGDLKEEEFLNKSGPWRDQGLCLVDWGRGIDLRLFPDHTVFNGDCRTSGFRCIEMQEKRAWKFQVDAYGLCVAVHLMLHNNYMEIVKKESSEGGYVYQPRLPFKRYWNVELWKTFFTKMLNQYPGNDDRSLLQELRKSFEDYMGSNPQLIRKLKELLVKQRTSLCSA